MPFDTPITLSPAAYAADALRRLGNAADADKMPVKFSQRTTTPQRHSAIGRIWRLLVEWRARRGADQTMRDLSRLDDRLLADIGLVRGDAAYSAVVANWYVGGCDHRPRSDRRGLDGWDHL